MKPNRLIASFAVITFLVGSVFGAPLFHAVFAETETTETTQATDDTTIPDDTEETTVEDPSEDEEVIDEESGQTDGEEESTETTDTSNTGSSEQSVLSTNTNVTNNNTNDNNNVNVNNNNVEVNPVIENHVSNYIETNNTHEVVYETDGGYEVYEEPVVYETPETGAGAYSLLGLIPAGLIGSIFRRNLFI